MRWHALADSLVPIHPVVRRFLARPNSPPVLAFLRSPLSSPFSAGSWEKYPCTMARRSPPHFFRRATIEKERMFEGVKVSREIHPKFSLCFDDSLSTCIIVVGNFFCLFCLRFFFEILLFFFLFLV